MLLMEYIRIERSVFDAMLSALADCRSVLVMALTRLSRNERQEWIDNVSAQGILRRSQRGMTLLRMEGKIGYSVIEGKVYYPASEIGRLLNYNIESDG